MRIRIAVTVGQTCREVERSVLEGWLQLKGADFEKFIFDICDWSLEAARGPKGGMVVIPVNKENEAKSSVARENVSFDRKFLPFVFLLVWRERMTIWLTFFSNEEFSRVVRRAYEQPA